MDVGGIGASFLLMMRSSGRRSDSADVTTTRSFRRPASAQPCIANFVETLLRAV